VGKTESRQPSLSDTIEAAVDSCIAPLRYLADHNKGLLSLDVGRSIGKQIRARVKWIRKNMRVRITMDGQRGSLYALYADYVNIRDLRCISVDSFQRGFAGRKTRLSFRTLQLTLYALAEFEARTDSIPKLSTCDFLQTIGATRSDPPTINLWLVRSLWLAVSTILLVNPSAISLIRRALARTPVCGQAGAKRALEIAAAGGHNLLLLGPPGCGKTMLARRLPSILPPMTSNEALEVTKVYSVAGLLGSRPGIVRARPFRFPHHTISQTALVGGGSIVKPGEISLAHHGVLFLDELPEFARGAIEVMRQPIEEGTVTIARASGTFTYPARFMLVASMNPCPCGYRGTRSAECRCDDAAVAKYISKLSGPLLDRIDLQIEVSRVPFDDMVRTGGAERSATIRARVLAARERQRTRFEGTPLTCNAEIPANGTRAYCRLDGPAMQLLKRASDRKQFSARALDRIARAARTIADLAESDEILAEHVAEAVHYRSLERLATAA